MTDQELSSAGSAAPPPVTKTTPDRTKDKDPLNSLPTVREALPRESKDSAGPFERKKSFRDSRSKRDRDKKNGEEKLILDPSGPNRTLPTRELLEIVKKYSAFLRPSTQAQQDGHAEVVEGSAEFWREMVDMFFVRGQAQHAAQHQDDMLFFVRPQNLMPEYGSQLSYEETLISPYFVRRWASELPKVVAYDKDVDWRRSFYLNLIVHTTFALTVAVCSRRALSDQRKTGGGPPVSVTPMFKVTKTVYASPACARIDMDTSKAQETVPSYPDICFAVDDYDDSFDSVILSDPDHCFCVLLNARGGASFPIDDDTDVPFKRSLSKRSSGEGGGGGDSHKVTLFSGFVGYDMVRSAFNGGRGKLATLFPYAANGRAERLVMKGPGGRGEADVAVTNVPPARLEQVTPHQVDSGDQSSQTASASPSQDEGVNPPGNEPIGNPPEGAFGLFVRKAAQVARSAANNVASAYAVGRSESGPLPLRCCLMSLSLPWDSLAFDLLFKNAGRGR
ncbi:hypothetical protein CBR_g49495 [Chara braunii]|uniref:Uncharacterized protein n=1 Tax=Chara braunii TaxID=69332 RepID=A0A388K503_CHABU|nr:hypothetical protein CBR_g49495 [Chara braunii]|eukprot:GBG65134.1 hypothetical protein CBR_g49495 [Chara braunii]